MSSTPPQNHWAIVELLARYANLLAHGDDAASRYPEVAQHLETCSDCQQTLADLQAMPPDGGSWPLTQSVDDLWFVQPPDESGTRIHPDSHAGSFGAQFNIDPQEYLEADDSEPLRGYGPAQQGGRLLLYRQIMVGDEPLLVMLTYHAAHAGRDSFVQGHVAGAGSLAATACLQIDEQFYYASIEEGMMRFDAITLDDDVDDLTLTIETPTT